jgi:small subunit ribosomal protein S1
MKADFEVGDVVTGQVYSFDKGGVIVQLREKLFGYLRNTDISWSGSGMEGSDVFDCGEMIKVIITAVKYSKSSKAVFVRLGYRELLPNPWENIHTHLNVGQRIEGRVVRILDFGAILDIGLGFTCLLHNSELSWTRRKPKASKFFCVGDVVPVIVQSIEATRRRIGVSYRAGQPNPWDTLHLSMPMGAEVSGTVTNVVAFGVYIELENGCVALLHKSQMPDTYTFIKDRSIKVRILTVDAQTQRISVALA